MIALGFLVLFFFGATILNLRFSHDITFTGEERIAIPSVTIADPQLGTADALVKITVFSDFSCGSCATLDSMLMEFLLKYPEETLLVWKDMPNETRHSEALRAALAARCAGKQGKFWEYHAQLFARQSQLGEDLYHTLAGEIGLDTPSFALCLEQEETRPLVERTLSEGFALDITATPTFFVNGERFTGSLSKTDVERVLHEALSP